jgi:hypothetical protein
MAFPTSFNGWIAYIRNWIGADEYSDAQVGSFLDLGQVKLNTDLSSFHMEKLHHKTILAPDHAQPINLQLEIPDFNKIRLVVVQGVGPLDVEAMNEYQKKAQDLTNTCYTPSTYVIDAQKLYINPWPAEDAVVDIYYYEMVPSLSASVASNTFSLHHPDLLLYAASLEAAPYMVEDERIPVWENKYTGGVLAANAASAKIKMGSTPLKRQVTGMS